MASLFVGIAGGTGSGKTTVAARLCAELGEQAVLMQHDSYYRPRPELSPEERDRLNFDHPDALDTELLCEHLGLLAEGRSVEVPIYDFSTHLRSSRTWTVRPAPVVVVEGILVFLEEKLRNCFQLKIFVDTDADIRVMRRIERDLNERGRSFQQVRDQYFKTVRPMHLQFVEPTKRYADVIVPEGGHNDVALNLIVARLKTVV